MKKYFCIFHIASKKQSKRFLSIFTIFVLVISSLTGIFIPPQVVQAAEPTYGWAKTIGGTSYDYGQGISVDSSGNV